PLKPKKIPHFFHISSNSIILSPPLSISGEASSPPLAISSKASSPPLLISRKQPYHCDSSYILTSEPHLLNLSCKNLCRSLPSP
ncbi:unnamed protein product, partial [Brassica rapa subsp. trilocularis]